MAQMMAGIAMGQQIAGSINAPKPEAAAGGAPAADGKTVVERLKEIKELHETGILTDEEYAAKRADLVKLL
jgi:hypothetical protein